MILHDFNSKTIININRLVLSKLSPKLLFLIHLEVGPWSLQLTLRFVD